MKKYIWLLAFLCVLSSAHAILNLTFETPPVTFNESFVNSTQTVCQPYYLGNNLTREGTCDGSAQVLRNLSLSQSGVPNLLLNVTMTYFGIQGNVEGDYNSIGVANTATRIGTLNYTVGFTWGTDFSNFILNGVSIASNSTGFSSSGTLRIELYNASGTSKVWLNNVLKRSQVMNIGTGTEDFLYLVVKDDNTNNNPGPEMDNIYVQNTPLSPPFLNNIGFPTTPTPANLSTINANIIPINVTLNATYANNNVTLWVDGAKVNSSIFGAGNNQLISFTRTLTSGTHTLFFNATNNETSVLSQINTIFVNALPAFASTINPPNATTIRSNNVTFDIQGIGYIAFNATLNINGTANQTKAYAAGTNNVTFNLLLADGTYGGSINLTTWEGSNLSGTTNIRVDTQTYVTPIYSNYLNTNGANWTRTIIFNASIDGCSSQVSIQTLIDGVVRNNVTYACSSFISNAIGNYTTNESRVFNISLRATGNNGFRNYDVTTANTSFRGDAFNPTVQLNRSFVIGLANSTQKINVSMTCFDEFANITYNLTFNAANLFYANKTNGTLQRNETTYIDGTNTLTGVCSDPFGSTTQTLTFSLLRKIILYVDELTGTPFNISLVTGAKVWLGDNTTFFDLYASNTNNVTVIGDNSTKIRAEITYTGGVVIPRFFDLSMVPETIIKVCANAQGATYRGQLLASSSQIPAIMKNAFTQCYVGADYTRFSYQDTFILQTFTIDSNYYLYTYSGGAQVLLAAVDGSISTTSNLDSLILAMNAQSISIGTDALVVSALSYNQTQIRYRDLGNSTSDVNISISRTDTGEVLILNPSITDPNNFYVVFDYSTLPNVTAETQFSVTFTRTNSQGRITTVYYFSAHGSPGLLYAPLGFLISLLVIVCGSSVTVSRTQFSWFGILVMLGGLAVLNYTQGAWYITFLQVVEVILMVWIGWFAVNQNNQVMA